MHPDFPLTNFWIGMVKKRMGDYEKAKQYFQGFLNQDKLPIGRSFIESAKEEIENCDWAIGSG